MKLQMKPKTIAILVVVILFVIILFQNSEQIELQLLFWSITRAPMFLLIAFTLLIGVAIGWFGHLMYARGKSSAQQTAPVQSTGSAPQAPDNLSPLD